MAYIPRDRRNHALNSTTIKALGYLTTLVKCVHLPSEQITIGFRRLGVINWRCDTWNKAITQKLA
jgi:hypothetical protein